MAGRIRDLDGAGHPALACGGMEGGRVKGVDLREIRPGDDDKGMLQRDRLSVHQEVPCERANKCLTKTINPCFLLDAPPG